MSLVDHDDEPVNLVWSSKHQGYGYFSPSAGWITVPDAQLTSFGINFEDLFDRLLLRIQQSAWLSPVMLLPELLWEIGGVRLPGRGKHVPLWIGRRLSDPEVWRQFTKTVRHRPAPGLRIVLSLTPASRHPDVVFQGHAIVAVQDVADRAGGLVVDPDLLAARVASGALQNDAPIAMGADGASITVRGRRYTFSGSKQRGVIRQLFEAWRVGAPECLTAEPQRLVFLDETSVKTNLTRPRGRAPIGERLYGTVPFGKWRTQTFIAGLTSNELIAPWVIEGAMNQAAFEAHVESQLAPQLSPGTVVILDNLSTHRSPRAAEALKKAKSWFLFLPPYSPDLNPIEQAFSKLKAHLRRIGARTYDELLAAIGDVCAFFNPTECWNFFCATGYASD